MIEVMKQALEALENGKRVRSGDGGTKHQVPLEDAAICALRQAIKQAEREPCEYCKRGLKTMCLCHLKPPTAPAQPPTAPAQPLTMTEMVDAAMVATADIYPPITRRQCERIIWAAAHGIKGASL